MKLAAAALAMMVVACHSAPAPVAADKPVAAAPTPTPLRIGSLPSVVKAEPPPIATPDLDLVARWPLGLNEHPAAEPSFDVAGALADPGITWQDLCRRGAQFRHLSKDQDLVAYLSAWCAADPRDAAYQLGLLAHSPIRGIAQVIAIDAARILADRVDGASVEGILRHANLLDAATVDLIAASYFELGKLDDAAVANQLAIALDTRASEATVCHRLVRAIASVTDGDARDTALADLERRSAQQPPRPDTPKPRPPDSTCVELSKAVGLDAGDPIAIAIRKTRVAWPSNGGTFDDWEHVFTLSRLAWPDPRAIELAVPALELEVESSQCDRGRLGVARADARELLLHVTDREVRDDVDATIARASKQVAACIEDLRRD